MTVKIKDIPKGKTINDFPDDTEFSLDDRPIKYDPKTYVHIHPGQPGYDTAITKEQAMKLIGK